MLGYTNVNYCAFRKMTIKVLIFLFLKKKSVLWFPLCIKLIAKRHAIACDQGNGRLGVQPVSPKTTSWSQAIFSRSLDKGEVTNRVVGKVPCLLSICHLRWSTYLPVCILPPFFEEILFIDPAVTMVMMFIQLTSMMKNA